MMDSMLLFVDTSCLLLVRQGGHDVCFCNRPSGDASKLRFALSGAAPREFAHAWAAANATFQTRIFQSGPAFAGTWSTGQSMF